MSLINEALKRAKQAQTPPSPPPSLEFRPIDPSQVSSRRDGLLLPFALGGSVVLVLMLGWMWLRQGSPKSGAQSESVSRAVAPAAPSASTISADVPGPRPSPGIQQTGSPNSSQPAPAAAPVQLATAAPVRTTAPTAPSTPPAQTAPIFSTLRAPESAPAAGAAPSPAPAAPVQPAAVPVAAPVADTVAGSAPKPAPLRLQGIMFDPTHPSAIISGETVYVGDRVGELEVVAISQKSATLAGGGQTNILTLPR